MTRIRRIQNKYGISSQELAQAAGVSQQRINELVNREQAFTTDYQQKLIEKGVEVVVNRRLEALCQLYADFLQQRGNLLLEEEREE